MHYVAINVNVKEEIMIMGEIIQSFEIFLSFRCAFVSVI